MDFIISHVQYLRTYVAPGTDISKTMGVARILIGGNLKSEAVCTVLVGLLKLQYSQSVRTIKQKAQHFTIIYYL